MRTLRLGLVGTSSDARLDMVMTVARQDPSQKNVADVCIQTSLPKMEIQVCAKVYRMSFENIEAGAYVQMFAYEPTFARARCTQWVR